MRNVTRTLALSLGLCLALSSVGTPAQEKDKGGKDDLKYVTTKSGLKYADVKVGTGAEAKKGDNVEVHYTGTFTDGKKFDSSRDRNRTFTFSLGAGEVIKGWDEGVAGMKVGGTRKLVIPANLAYGEKGRGPIPGNSTLLFDVELISIKK